jgi:hypothetical protein
MPIDPSIAMGFRNPQIQVQNPVAQYAQAQELNLNALKMQEAQQSMASRNMLRNLDPSSPDYINQVSRVDPKLGLELSKGRATIKKEEGLTAKNAAELEGQYVKNSRDTLVGVNDQATYDIWRTDTISKMPGLAQIIPAQFSPQVKTALMSDAKTYLDRNTLTQFQKENLGIQREGQRLQYDPTRQGEIAGAKATAQEVAKREAAGNIDVTSNRKALATAGYDVSTGKDDVSELIKKSTGSYLGKGYDISGRLFGVSNEGSKALQTLTQKANAITFGLLNGKLGAGISKSDAELVASLVGQLGDGTLPREDRLAAWESAKNNMIRLGMLDEPTGSTKPTSTPSAKPTPSGKTPALPSGFTLD